MTASLRWILAALFCAVILACSEPKDQGGDTQTNWLRACATDAECGPLACRCGVCTRTCSADLDCDGAPTGVACRAADSVETMAQCGAGATEGLCLGPSLSPAITLASFCEEYLGAGCEHAADCGCSAEAAADCSRTLARCAEANAPFSQLEAEVAAGDIVFDGKAASALVARIKSPGTSCLSKLVAVGFDSYAARSFGGVFRGTRPAGSPCTRVDVKKDAYASQCEAGYFCMTGADGTSTCVPLAGPGEPCPVVPGNTGSSCLERRAPDRDGEFESAFASLACVPTAPGSTTGICGTAAPDGTPCEDPRQCAGGVCDHGPERDLPIGSCAPKRANGAECQTYQECASGSCTFGLMSTCEPQLPDGSACNGFWNCTSGGCNDPDPVTALGTCGPPTTPAPLPMGSACVEHEECADDAVCDSGFCGARICLDD